MPREVKPGLDNVEWRLDVTKGLAPATFSEQILAVWRSGRPQLETILSGTRSGLRGEAHLQLSLQEIRVPDNQTIYGHEGLRRRIERDHPRVSMW